MKDTIGATAGKVWELLKKKGEMNLTQVPKLIDDKSPQVYMAIGWLAREGKLVFSRKGTKNFVSLNE